MEEIDFPLKRTPVTRPMIERSLERQMPRDGPEFELVAAVVAQAVIDLDSGESAAARRDAEFTVLEGRYARRKIWQYLVLSGGKLGENGESIAAGITRSMLRAVLESSRGVSPDDHGDQANAARRISGWEDFNGITFLCKVGVEHDKTGRYEDRNPDCRIFGVTATPARGDGLGMRRVFDNCADQISMHSLIAMGCLVKPRTYVCALEGTDERLAGLSKTPSGEFDLGSRRANFPPGSLIAPVMKSGILDSKFILTDFNSPA